MTLLENRFRIIQTLIENLIGSIRLRLKYCKKGVPADPPYAPFPAPPGSRANGLYATPPPS